jgi:hypothetical protein
MSQPNVLTMSDEEFLKQDFSAISTEAAPVVVETPAVVEEPAAVVADPVVAADPVATPDPAAVVADPAVADPVVVDPVVADPVVADPAAVVENPVDYKAAYESLIGRTFKAGGKEVTVKTPEEAIQLMQMGVGFHQKSAKLSQHQRFIATLEENGLLDESKINELIDISKKKPEAIAALVQSAGLEPHQLIPSGDAQPYQPGDHVLPDAQLQFRTSVEEIREQGGTEFLTHVAQDWDVTSRAEIYKDPAALPMLYGHKQDGIYDQISSEVDRRKVFDPSMANLPFIHAYLAVGKEMHEKGQLVPKQAQTTPTPAVATPTPVPVAVKPAVASQPVTPNPAAAKAASVRSAPTPATATPNYLTMSDEEFKKHHMT